jgi:hypothetical protein
MSPTDTCHTATAANATRAKPPVSMATCCLCGAFFKIVPRDASIWQQIFAETSASQEELVPCGQRRPGGFGFGAKNGSTALGEPGISFRKWRMDSR